MKIIKESDSWKKPSNHYIMALKDEWYRQLIKLENLITEETIKFYSKKGIITMHLPVTTGSISSPMGRGSDSLPVKVEVCGVKTYLQTLCNFY